MSIINYILKLLSHILSHFMGWWGIEIFYSHQGSLRPKQFGNHWAIEFG